MEETNPRRVSDKIHELCIDGYLIPFIKNRQPLPLSMPGTEDLFIAVFSTLEKLKIFCKEYKLEYGSIKKIEEQWEFLDSLEARFRVAVDPYKHENGKCRFKEIRNPNAS